MINNSEVVYSLYSLLTSEASPEFFYSYCPVLLQSLLKQMVDTLVSRLLPALLVSQSADPYVAYNRFRYLEHVCSLSWPATAGGQLHTAAL